jgi:hypothetical protein
MRMRPFLSHRRADQRRVVELKRILSLYGAGGWRDLDDLHAGELNAVGFEQAINHDTGGFIWYGTSNVLTSEYVNSVEIPIAVTRKLREPNYPLVPIFASIEPHQLAEAKNHRLSGRDFEMLRDANGVIRNGQTLPAWRRDVARRYIRAAVRAIDATEYTIAATAFTPPDGHQDFTLDWRSVLDEDTRELTPGTLPILVDALRTLRDAIKPTEQFPHITLDIDMPLPLAALIGYEWRVTSRLRLTIRQRTGAGTLEVAGDGSTRTDWPDWTVRDHGRQGPCVVAVSTTPDALTAHLQRYADQVGAGQTLDLHVPGQLDADGIRGLAREITGKLREACDNGADKHLLLAGPAALAVLVGAANNGNGTLTMPFWNGSTYVSPIVIGGTYTA